MSRHYRCGTNDTRCPNALRRSFDVGDLETWSCPAGRADCKLRLEPVSWGSRHPGLAWLAKVVPVLAVLAALTWWLWPDFLLRQAERLSRDAWELSKQVKSLSGEEEADWTGKLATLEGKASSLGPETAAPEQAKSLLAEVQAARTGLASGAALPASSISARLSQLRPQLEEVAATAGQRGHVKAEAVARAAIAELSSMTQSLEAAGTAREQNRQGWLARLESLERVASLLEKSVDLWQRAEHARGTPGSAATQRQLEETQVTLTQQAQAIQDAAGDVKEIATLERAGAQLGSLRLPAAPELPEGDVEKLGIELRALRANMVAKPAHHAGEILSAAEQALRDGEGQRAFRSRTRELAERRQDLLQTIAQRRQAVEKEWVEAERALVVHAVGGLADGLAVPLADAFLAQVLRAEARVVKSDETGVWLGFRQGARKALVEIRRSPDRTSYSCLREGCDLSVTARPPTTEEVAANASLGDPRSPECAQVIALDAVAVLFKTGHSPESVEAGQIPGHPRLIPATTSAESYLLAAMKEFALLGTGTAESAALMPDALPAAGQSMALGSYSAYSRAPGRCNLAAVQAEADTPSFAPSPFTVSTEDYKYSVRILAVHQARPRTPLVGEFTRFAASQAGQTEVGRAGFVDLTPRLGNDKPYPPIPPNARRLSPSLRFEFGQAQLDIKALADLERVVRRISEPDLQQQYVFLAGHTDNVGADSVNDRLALERASQVSKSLAQRGLRRLKTHGFGKLYPIDTNETEAGKQKNRRVEIWVSPTAPN